MSGTKTVAVVISGRVQGVSYRAWTEREARARGLSGHVLNCEDGTVEAMFSGPEAAVDAMLAACRQGPPGARVDDVVATAPAEAPPSGFRILS
ncbi:acylphosphatase [Methylobacterium radiodurans]|uniref:acylphosphatase n=1 Tax=Methylobacterium radiodurans TaxID=2202828 RepID=A0A2U8VW52_9HYPH|nr:acylphosphatase [Methylobacterium radiodurans]AWN38073.1 acylphosphatase [Methylobacterium radiodurans]